jgi:hypothetical protein
MLGATGGAIDPERHLTARVLTMAQNLLAYRT